VNQPPVRQLIDSFARLRVLVVGDAMLDSYSTGLAHRLCPEAPVPVVEVAERIDLPGGAANTAVNLRALGAHVSLVSVVGDDCEAGILTGLLNEAGVDVRYLRTEPRRGTLAKHRIAAGGQLIARVDQGGTQPLHQQVEAELAALIRSRGGEYDAIVVSDYSYGVMTPTIIRALPTSSAQPVVVVDAKDLRRYADVRPAAVKPNRAQAMELLGLQPGATAGRMEILMREASRILELTRARVAAITLDSEGALTVERGREPYRTYAHAAPAGNTSGAGDTFLSVLTLALAAGAATPTAAELASAGAAMVVSKKATATCAPGELLAYLTGREKRVPDLSVLRTGLDYERRRGRTIVFTNGCFDIVHAGHTAYLNQAKSLGDVLVVGVNSDQSVRRLKGPTRPINNVEDRVAVLSALSCVDYIVEFDEETPVELIRAIRPDVFVKGGDYSREMLPEAQVVEELGGRVHILPYVEDRSTSGIIERVRERTGAAAG
jgi:D-beta-D-heptose 7-phosphate kinase/D-beta-D-heptose 1-phosphate adenosyltransferase